MKRKLSARPFSYPPIIASILAPRRYCVIAAARLFHPALERPSPLLWLLGIDFILPPAFVYPPSVILGLED